jgi:hypothetical protein
MNRRLDISRFEFLKTGRPCPTRVQRRKGFISHTIAVHRPVDFLPISTNGGIHMGSRPLAMSNICMFEIPQAHRGPEKSLEVMKAIVCL